ncbi:hypothetical protein BASA81_002489 [Batrachochytrium salamandrivorans]|nr:hypothetical protein BASA81_002489 [Batrachochytrium salamandrivorans]
MSAALSRSQSMRHVQVRMSNFKAGALLGSGLVLAAGAYKVNSDEGLQRAVKFYRVVTVPFLKYRFYDWYTKDWVPARRSEWFKAMHREYSPLVVQTVMEMKGFYIKLGQMMGGFDGLLPDEYVSALKVFQNDCPTRPVKQVMRTIEQELGRPFSEVFMSIDSKPLGSASIGQVHKAKLLNGQEVCVKVQHPDAERFFTVDVGTTKAFVQVALPEHLPAFSEIEKLFPTEFNYVGEAQNLRDMRAALESHPEFRRGIVIPEPLLCTKKVLVMSFIKGETLQSKQHRYLTSLAEAEGKSVEQIEHEFKQKLAEGGKPLSPPSETVLMAYRAVLRARDLVRNGFCLGFNFGFGHLAGCPIAYEWSELPMKATDALDSLYSFFGYTLFHDGIFSSDSHGGNVMHLENEKLGLIDMGQVKRLDHDVRTKFAKLVVALAHDHNTKEDTKKIAALWRDCGYATKYSNDDIAADVARFNFDRFTDDIVEKYGGLHVMMETISKADPLVSTPDEYIMIMRLSAMLRMNALGLGQGGEGTKHSRVCHIWEKYALDYLNSV